MSATKLLRLRIVFRLFIATALFASQGISRTVAADLSARVSRVDLTPPLDMKSPLGGYGARMNQPAVGIHDRVFAKAVLLADGERQFMLITCDLLGLTPPVKQEIIKRVAADGWSVDEILILPSHSHASIEMNAINPNNIFGIPQIGIHDPELYEFTVNNFVQLIRQTAAAEPQPVKVGTTSQQIPGWNRNRRGDTRVTDDELTITRIDTLQDEPLAVLVNFTAHPTFMSEHEMMFSAGWPGELQQTLESVIGADVTAMYYNGAQGDQAPQARPNSGSSRWEMAAKYGRELGLVAAKQWQDVPTQSDVTFGFHLQPIELPERSWHPDFMATGGTEYGLSEELLRDMLPRLSPTQTTSGSLRLGELLLIGIPGELATGLGLQVKADAKRITGANHPVIGGLANEWVSYILSQEAYRSGKYEASISFYGETLGPTIVDGALGWGEATEVNDPSQASAASSGLALRVPIASDASAIVAAVQSSLTELARWMPWATPDYNIELAGQWIDGEFGDVYRFVMIGPTGEIVGACGLNSVDSLNRRANLGYWVRSDQTRRGYATTAARFVANHGLAAGLQRLEIVVAKENLASQRVAERIGAKFECVARDRLWLHETKHDALIFSLVTADLDATTTDS